MIELVDLLMSEVVDLLMSELVDLLMSELVDFQATEVEVSRANAEVDFQVSEGAVSQANEVEGILGIELVGSQEIKGGIPVIERAFRGTIEGLAEADIREMSP